MSLIAVAIIAGASVGAYGAIQAGKAAEAQSKSEQDILNFNAQQKIKEAQEQREAAAAQAKKFKRRGEALKGEQRVAISRGGVLVEGTPALLLEETAQELEADRLSILEQGFLRGEFAESEAFGLRFQGTSARARGKNLKRGSRLTAAGTLLTGVGIGLAARKAAGGGDDGDDGDE